MLILATTLIIIAAGLFVTAWDDAPEPADPYPLDKACYTIHDRAGNTFKSWFAPTLTADGTGMVWNNDHAWGIVLGAASFEVDRDCLRERYPDRPGLVPPLQGSDY